MSAIIRVHKNNICTKMLDIMRENERGSLISIHTQYRINNLVIDPYSNVQVFSDNPKTENYKYSLL